MMSFTKPTTLLLLLTFISQLAFAIQPPPTKKGKRREAVVYTDGGKLKGLVYAVTDSSLMLLSPGSHFSEISFKEVHKIKLRPPGDRYLLMGTGLVFGAISGGLAGGSMASKGREGEPGAMAGVAGAILGVVIGGLLGAFLLPLIFNLILNKKILVQHTTQGYTALKLKLQQYTIR